MNKSSSVYFFASFYASDTGSLRWSPNGSKDHQFSRTFLWTVSIISISPVYLVLFSWFGIVLVAPTMMSNTVTFRVHNFFSPLARSRYLSSFSLPFNFTLICLNDRSLVVCRVPSVLSSPLSHAGFCTPYSTVFCIYLYCGMSHFSLNINYNRYSPESYLFWFHYSVNHYYYYYYLLLFFTSALADGLSLEFEL